MFHRCTNSSLPYHPVSEGNLAILKFLHYNHLITECDTTVFDIAASCGYLSIVRFLSENRTEVCTSSAYDDAAKGGHLKVFKYLIENRTEGFTEQTFHNAKKFNRNNILQYITENKLKANKRIKSNANRDDAFIAAVTKPSIFQYPFRQASTNIQVEADDETVSDEDIVSDEEIDSDNDSVTGYLISLITCYLLDEN
ncbi:hypothetical protein PPL_06893 [Heterostelium album PN500]|uniref:Ankyrin repeat protein n=1 Tax=Heterostelium pallidum (strain ATCC 26659 / Pp 5 / PN500) TaxID=670386 RepID=D3BDU0_HETP5|nr:hypothetical protein PPL_06893 [Heterostelium album PN500]EFA80071.1 hypothetical protein PPL_06893 [Heterostelium album PN500]|eukprot:XP_020432191.1 hypothetical protein PPL_06893 [Heterostelium album PN500]